MLVVKWNDLENSNMIYVLLNRYLYKNSRKWGNAVMRRKSFFFAIFATKNGKKLLLGQQLQLTIKQIVTKNG